MTNEELILERLDRIEAQLAPISQTANGIKDLREDMIPLSGQAFRLLIRELEDVESGFQLEDLLTLLKRTLRRRQASVVLVGRCVVAAGFCALLLHTSVYAAFLEDPLTWALLAMAAALRHVEVEAGVPT